MSNQKWYATTEALQQLGISAKTLQRRRPTLTYGTHYRSISQPMAERQTYQYNVPEIEKLWAVEPHKR